MLMNSVSNILFNGAYLSALIGGILIGLSATLYWFVLGRVLGISGILKNTLQNGLKGFRETQRTEGASYDNDEVRLWLLVGLLLGGVLVPLLFTGFEVYAPKPKLPIVMILASGLLVGIGSSLGNGCTSGHGVCGMSRGSIRSIVATCVFMATGFVTVYVTQHVLK
jgi:uncharacterized protein